MKRKTFVTLNTSQGSLKVKRHDVILTNPEKEDSLQGEGETSCHHITILKELEIETPEEDAEDAPQSLEDGGQSTVDELKEVNLGTIEEPRPTFISASLSSEEEDFHDLNNACPKDDFPLSIIEIMVDATTGHEALSFMDGSNGYNQIRMSLSYEEITAFRTPKGIYCYKVMPFVLKNVGATYQRAMQKVFDDILHKYVECYANDLVVKSKR
ncbi:RNA-directed DNA polymerase-like protein [Cucumis melo var. makuwa]|uniref:RNA-directed DNA polymerase-like protein n=1 Tax=Cucumis melo var. makuwa TaxID=1194695 RepID=A0A5D3BCZ1_CUCMM|nr:RNA-directed DNA polymerase-like protein [Cucumis melo var. makuwa]